jgi:DNA-nicking Smr family endonuclease
MAKQERPSKRGTNPFSTLKGFAVSTPPPPSPLPNAKPSPQPPEAEDLFASAMSRLGVKGRSPAPRKDPAQEQTSPAAELALFLEALGEMDAVLVKEDDQGRGEAAEVQLPLAQEERLGRITPEETLDLHGLTRAEALAKVAWFVDNANYNGCRYLLIITGRGRQSGEAVLREAVEEWLRGQGAKKVREWGRAPARLGGDGALLLLLRKQG